jgi:hypothetical protein
MVIRVIYPYQIETPIVKFYNEPFNIITANENSQGTLYILWLDHVKLPKEEHWIPDHFVSLLPKSIDSKIGMNVLG